MSDTREKMFARMKLGEILIDTLPENHPWEGEVSKLADQLFAAGVTVQELDGCEYCKYSKSVYHHSSGVHASMDEDVYISGNNIVVDIGCHSYGTAEIKFCPMCGRKLPQPPKEDKE